MKNLFDLVNTLSYDDVEKLEEQLADANIENLRENRRKYTAANPDLNENCKWLAVQVAKRYDQAVASKAPTPIGAFDRDEIARVLATETNFLCDWFFYDAKNATRRAHAAGRRKALPVDRILLSVVELNATERATRRTFIEVFKKYLEQVMRLADKFKLAEAKVRYETAYELVLKALDNYDQHPLPAKEALAVIDAEEKATELLIAGMKGTKK